MAHDYIIRLSDLPQYMGISQPTIWRAIKRGDLPQPIALTARARGYRKSTIDGYLAQRQGPAGGAK